MGGRKCDKINRPLFSCPALQSRTAASWTEADGSVVTPALKFEMRIIHRIINFCIRATLKMGPRLYGKYFKFWRPLWLSVVIGIT